MSVVAHDFRCTGKLRVSAAAATAQAEVLVITDGDDGIDVIRAWLASEFNIGDPHPDDADLVLVEAEATLIENIENIWGVSLTYSTPTGGSVPSADPLSRPAEIRWFGGADLREYRRDAEDTPLMNSAHEPYDVLPQRYEGFFSLEYTKNVSTFDLDDYCALHLSINDADVTIDGRTIGHKRGLLVFREAPKLTENGTTYYRVTFEVLITPSGKVWEDVILDAGYNELDLITGKLTPIRDTDGMELRKPWPLNGLGQKIQPFDPATDPVHRTFKPYTEQDWTALP
jgi:hypothetical protein